MEDNSSNENHKGTDKTLDISKHLTQMSRKLENIEQSSILGKLIEGVSSELLFHTQNIQKKSNTGLKESFLFSGRYLEWFISFTKKDTLLLEYLLEYQRTKVGYEASSLEERMIRDTFMDFFIEEGFEDTFEATILFTEIGFLEEPTEEIKRCIKSPNFLNILKLASQIGRIMKSYESITKSATFYNNLVTLMSTYSKSYQVEEERVDITKSFNAAVALLYHRLRLVKHSVTIESDIPPINISFKKILNVWSCIIELMIQSVENQKEKEISVCISKDEEYVRVDFLVNCQLEREQLNERIRLIKQEYVVQSNSSVTDYKDVRNQVKEYNGKINIIPKKNNNGINCVVDIPIM